MQHAVFFTLYPDPEIADGARRLALGLGLKPVARPHVSLVGLSDDPAPPSQPWIDRVTAAAARVRHPPFLIELDTVSSFKRTRRGLWPVVLCGEDGVIGVTLLCEALRAALASEGLGGRAASTPHLTLSWSEGFAPERRTQPFRWMAREFLLVDSLQGAGRHEVLGRWSLKGEAADASDRIGGGH